MRPALASLALLALLAAAPASAGAFGIAELGVAITEGEGEPAALAGSHPYAIGTRIVFERDSAGRPEGDLRELSVELPTGLIENPAAVPVCSARDFQTPRSSPYEASRSGESCPEATQIGTVAIESPEETRHFGVFNLAPPPGSPARFGFSPYGAPITVVPELREADGEHGVTLRSRNITQLFAIAALEMRIWGTPWVSDHDGLRGECLNEIEPAVPHAQCPVPLLQRTHPTWAYLTLPTDCAGPLAFTAWARSWQQPDLADRAEAAAPALEGCDQLSFFPQALVALSTARSSSPTGLTFEFETFQGGGPLLTPSARVQSQVRRAQIALPPGLTINPAVGSGLGACAPAQYAAERAWTPPGAGCPGPSKVGTLSLRSPLLAEPLTGSVYLAEPDRNPFDSPLALYLVAKAPEAGVIVKVAGELRADPRDGRLVATFDRLPQLPYAELKAEFRSGQRALLSSPPACGVFVSTVDLAPWSDPGASLRQTANFAIDSGLTDSGACPAGPLGFAPRATAGSLNANAGAATPFYLRLTRRDSEQEITSYSAQLPRGVTASLAGVQLCSDAALAGAENRSGRAELASPSCPGASQIGRTFVGYGVGLAPAYAPGRMFLAGPYRGSELSLATVNAAVVGPFDLGVVVVRSALRIDPHTARLAIDSAASDPIPHILEGIPLRLRDIRAYIDRPGFARNPTSCEPSEVISTLGGSGARFSDPADDTSAAVATRFQLSNCSARGFTPRLALRLRGKRRRGAYPALRAAFAPRPGDANARRVQVTLPPSAFLAQEHIRTVCTRERFAASNCPPGSLYGRAVAHTPLLDGPLRGGAYLRSSTNRLPDLVFDLRSGPIRIVISGRIDSVGEGRIRASFEDLPDAPLDRFVLNMFGARRGLISNSANICRSRGRALARAIAQNNRGRVLRPAVAARCGKGKAGKAQKHNAAQRKAAKRKMRAPRRRG